MLSLFLGRKFLVLQFLLGCLLLLLLFFWEISSSGSGTICSFSGRISSVWWGSLRGGPCAQELCELCPVSGASFPQMCSMSRQATPKPSVRHHSACVSVCGTSSALSSGQPPCPAPPFGLGTPSNSTTVRTERHTLLLSTDTLQILGGLWMFIPVVA